MCPRQFSEIFSFAVLECLSTISHSHICMEYLVWYACWCCADQENICCLLRERERNRMFVLCVYTRETHTHIPVEWFVWLRVPRKYVYKLKYFFLCVWKILMKSDMFRWLLEQNLYIGHGIHNSFGFVVYCNRNEPQHFIGNFYTQKS